MVAAERRGAETVTVASLQTKSINSFAFSIIRINTVKDPVRSLRLSGGAETGVKRNAARNVSKYEADEPLVELLANSVENLLGTNSLTGREKSKPITFPVSRFLFCCQLIVHLHDPHLQM